MSKENEPPEVEDFPAFNFAIPVVLVSILNGMHSPAHLLMSELSPIWYPTLFVPVIPEVVFYISSLLISSMTLMIAGVPAALYERVTGARQSNFISMGIWLLGAAVLSIPSIGTLAKVMGWA